MSKLDELQQETTDFELLPLASDTKRLNQLMESDIYVYDESGVIGYCAIHDSEIIALFVHPGFRNVGIGKKMLEFFLAVGSRVCDRLDTLRRNHRRRQIYYPQKHLVARRQC